MNQTHEGVFRDGKVMLKDAPQFPDGTKVLVTFIAPPAIDSSPTGQGLRLGMFSDPTRRFSTEDDFKLVEWHGEDEVIDA